MMPDHFGPEKRSLSKKGLTQDLVGFMLFLETMILYIYIIYIYINFSLYKHVVNICFALSHSLSLSLCKVLAPYPHDS